MDKGGACPNSGSEELMVLSTGFWQIRMILSGEIR
jgi:hypothetical protein